MRPHLLFAVLLLVCPLANGQQISSLFNLYGLPSISILVEQEEFSTIDPQTTSLRAFDYFVAPRQVKDRVLVQLPDENTFGVALKNTNGDVLLEEPELFGDNQINVSHLVSGFYYLEIKSTAGVARELLYKL